MNIQHHTTPENLEKYSFLWSEVRLVIAAFALFAGGVPPILLLFNSGYGSPLSSVLALCWIISGVSAGYLLYRWYHTRMLFGGHNKIDLYAFFIMVISGINLGLTPIIGNLGMSLVQSRFIFFIVGILYLGSAYHLHRRFIANGKKIF